MSRMPIGVSACLLGHACRYDGQAKPCHAALELARDPRFEVVQVCPEVLGGLPTPRPPHEIVLMADGSAHIVDEAGNDDTDAFMAGARRTLDILRERGCACAVLKSRSPSCGRGHVYDGTFGGVLAEGDGVAARLLLDAGVHVISEEELARDGIDALLTWLRDS